jgi:hypothetical protein
MQEMCAAILSSTYRVVHVIFGFCRQGRLQVFCVIFIIRIPYFCTLKKKHGVVDLTGGLHTIGYSLHYRL